MLTFKKTEKSALPIGVFLAALLKAPFGETIIAINKNKPRITKEAVKSKVFVQSLIVVPTIAYKTYLSMTLLSNLENKRIV